MEKTATEFRYQDYFDLNIADKTNREEVVAALNELASVPEGLEKIKQAVALHGKIQLTDDPDQPASMQGNALYITAKNIENSVYLDAQGNKHPGTLLRGLAHEVYHLADEELTNYRNDAASRIAEIVKEGEQIAAAGYDEEKIRRTEHLKEVLSHPEAYSREEGMEAVRRLQAMDNKQKYIEGEGGAYYSLSAEFYEYIQKFEEPAVGFENRIMEQLKGEPARADYKQAFMLWDYRQLLSPERRQNVDSSGLPVNPEPAAGVTCSIPQEILEKINRGEMTLAQAGIVLDTDETLPDEHEGCLVVAPWTPSSSQSESKEPKR